MKEIMHCTEMLIHIMISCFFFHETTKNRYKYIFTLALWLCSNLMLHVISILFKIQECILLSINLIIPIIILCHLFYGRPIDKSIRFIIFSAAELVSLKVRHFFLINSPSTAKAGEKLIGSGIMLAEVAIAIILVEFRRLNNTRTLIPMFTVLGYSIAHIFYISAYYRINSSSITEKSEIIMMIFQALLYSMIIMQYNITVKMRNMTKKEEEMIAAEAEKESKQRYVSLADSKLNDITELKSDLNDQLSNVKRIMNVTSKKDETEIIMNKMLERLNRIKAVNYCDDHTLNAVLTVKLNEERVKDINIQTLLHDCNHIDIDNYEMCSLVSNMLDNAIECCLKEPDPSNTFIEMKSGVASGYFVLKVTNSCSISFDKRSEKGEGHGFGLKIVKEICNMHNGEFTIKQNNNKVISTAFLRVNQ